MDWLSILPGRADWAGAVTMAVGSIESHSFRLSGIVVQINSVSVFLGAGNITVYANEDPIPQPPPPSGNPSAARHFSGKVKRHIRCYGKKGKKAHQLHFSPSTDPTVLGYLLYQNGRFLTAIYNAGPFKFTLNCRKNKKYRYKLTAVNATGTSKAKRVILK